MIWRDNSWRNNNGQTCFYSKCSFKVRCATTFWMVKIPKDFWFVFPLQTSRHIGFHAEASLALRFFCSRRMNVKAQRHGSSVQRRCVGSFPKSLVVWWNDRKCTQSTHHLRDAPPLIRPSVPVSMRTITCFCRWYSDTYESSVCILT